jgi:hypothetical protein
LQEDGSPISTAITPTGEESLLGRQEGSAPSEYPSETKDMISSSPESNSPISTGWTSTISPQCTESVPNRYDKDIRSNPGSRQEQLLLPYIILPEAVLNIFFSRIHGKPFYILDEPTTRQKHQRGQLPVHLSMAICAITLRYNTYPSIKPMSPCPLIPFGDTRTRPSFQIHLCGWA